MPNAARLRGVEQQVAPRILSVFVTVFELYKYFKNGITNL